MEKTKECKHETVTGFTENGGLHCCDCGKEFLPTENNQNENKRTTKKRI